MPLENPTRKIIYLTTRAPITRFEKALELIQEHSETLLVLDRVPEIKLNANLRRKNVDAIQKAHWIRDTLKKHQSRHGKQDFEKVACSFEEQISSLESAIFLLYREVHITRRTNDNEGEATFQDKEDLAQSFESSMPSSKTIRQTIKQNAPVSNSCSSKLGAPPRNMAEASSIKDTNSVRSVPGKIKIPEMFLRRGIADGINEDKGYNGNQIQLTGAFMESSVFKEDYGNKVAEKSSRTCVGSMNNGDIFREDTIIATFPKYEKMNYVPAVKVPQEEINLKQEIQEKKIILNSLEAEVELYRIEEHIIDEEAKPGRVRMPFTLQAKHDNQRRSKTFPTEKIGMPTVFDKYARPNEIQLKQNHEERLTVDQMQPNEAVVKATEKVSDNSTPVKSSQKCIGTWNDETVLGEYAAAGTVASESTIDFVPKPTQKNFKISKKKPKKRSNFGHGFLQVISFIFV